MNYANSIIDTDIIGNGTGDSESNSALPLYKIHLINDEEETEEEDEIESCDEGAMTPKTLNSKPINRAKSSESLSKVQKMPKSMKIPNLWDIKIEKSESTDEEDGANATGPLTGSDCSEWEFL